MHRAPFCLAAQAFPSSPTLPSPIFVSGKLEKKGPHPRPVHSTTQQGSQGCLALTGEGRMEKCWGNPHEAPGRCPQQGLGLQLELARATLWGSILSKPVVPTWLQCLLYPTSSSAVSPVYCLLQSILIPATPTHTQSFSLHHLVAPGQNLLAQHSAGTLQ